MSASAEPGASVDAEAKAALLLRLRSQGIRSLAVLRAMEAVPRDAFVAQRFRDVAARDIALPIGCGQTTAEPSFVARSLEALACEPHHRVLEIGSGSGFVTALLARLAAWIVGVERYRGLAEASQARLAGQGIGHVSVAWDDGLVGPPPEVPFDRIIVQAALDVPPDALFDRLAPDGVIVYPLRVAGAGQHLIRATRGADGSSDPRRVCASRLQLALPGRSVGL